MNSKSIAAKDLAKKLFMIPDETGGHKFSLRQIAAEVTQQLTEPCTKGSIRNWSKKLSGHNTTWETEYKAMIAMGIGEAEIDKQERERGKAAEEVYQDKIAGAVRKVYAQNLELNDLAVTSIIAICKSISERVKNAFKKDENGNLLIDEGIIDKLVSEEDKKLLLSVKRDTDSILKDYRDNSAIRPAEYKPLDEMTDAELRMDDVDPCQW